MASRRNELKAQEESNNPNDDNNNSNTDESRHDERKLPADLVMNAECEHKNNWHLLDVDGQSVAASSVCSLSSSSEPDQQEQSLEHKLKRSTTSKTMTTTSSITTTTTTTRRKRTANGSIATKMAGGQRQQQQQQRALSPALVYICTALYALMPLTSVLAFVTLMSLLFTRYWLITVIYYTLLILDSNTCNRGGRRIDIFYKAKFWSYLAAYFPIELKYSQNFQLNPEENYILNYHPHGISAFGCVATFATNGLNFSQLFPGIRSRFMVHETSFLVPVMRETFALRGDCSVNSKSFDYILSKKWQQKNKTTTLNEPRAGNLLALCGGGLAEADLSDAQSLRVVAATRKGFVKKALIHGANLIPCIAFGENSVFTKVNLTPGSLLHTLENKFYQLFKFRHPIYYGRSFMANNNKSSRPGAMPYKRPITVIMADPIMVERVENPSQEQIDQLHGAYIERLKSLYEANKNLCTKYDVNLEIV